jgi:hypothetical protein
LSQEAQLGVGCVLSRCPVADLVCSLQYGFRQ